MGDLEEHCACFLGTKAKVLILAFKRVYVSVERQL